MENGELFEKGSGYYVLSEERFRRAQWFVMNYPGLPARNQQTGKFLWPYVPAEEPLLSNDSASASNPLSKLESIANKPGEYSSKLLHESQTEHAECKEMMKKLDEELYVTGYTSMQYDKHAYIMYNFAQRGGPKTSERARQS